MTTSGTYSWTLDVDEVIQEASEYVGWEITKAEEARSARRGINLILTDWQNKGISLWCVSTTTVSVTASTSSFSLAVPVEDILEAVVHETSTTDLRMDRINMEEYLLINNKSQTGRPSQFAVRREREGINVHLWPLGDEVKTLVLEVLRRHQDVDAAAQDVDVPRRFFPALCSGVAYRWALKRRDYPLEKVMLLKHDYEQLLKNAMDEDRERASTYLLPGGRR